MEVGLEQPAKDLLKQEIEKHRDAMATIIADCAKTGISPRELLTICVNIAAADCGCVIGLGYDNEWIQKQMEDMAGRLFFQMLHSIGESARAQGNIGEPQTGETQLGDKKPTEH